jgi:hypothetical protein
VILGADVDGTNNFLKRAFKPLLRQAGLPDVTFHGLRHTANSFLIEAGEDPFTIAGSLGHSDTRMMFERYGHLFDHTAKRVAKPQTESSRRTNRRTIVLNAADRFAQPRRKNAQIPYRIMAFPVVEMRGLETPTPYMRSKRSKPRVRTKRKK